jgi:hypothetical protein
MKRNPGAGSRLLLPRSTPIHCDDALVEEPSRSRQANQVI